MPQRIAPAGVSNREFIEGSSGMAVRYQRMAMGMAIGTGPGAALGSAFGDVAIGVAVGIAVGAAGGYVWRWSQIV